MKRWLARSIALLALCGPIALSAQQTSSLVSTTEFRVCADPANWPQSDDKGTGYENKIATLMAEALDLKLTYEWYPMSTGFVRNTLASHKCDVIIGFSAGDELVLNSNPYLVSTYLFIAKKGSPLSVVDRLSDEALQFAKIGVVAGTAPTSHLTRYNEIGNTVPYPLFVDRRYDNPTQKMIEDLVNDVTDAAIIWGPIAGPLLKSKYPNLVATPLLHEEGKPELTARITMAVRHGETDWKRTLNSQIRRLQDQIDGILFESGVPVLDKFGKEERKAP